MTIDRSRAVLKKLMSSLGELDCPAAISRPEREIADPALAALGRTARAIEDEIIELLSSRAPYLINLPALAMESRSLRVLQAIPDQIYHPPPDHSWNIFLSWAGVDAWRELARRKIWPGPRFHLVLDTCRKNRELWDFLIGDVFPHVIPGNQSGTIWARDITNFSWGNPEDLAELLLISATADPERMNGALSFYYRAGNHDMAAILYATGSRFHHDTIPNGFAPDGEHPFVQQMSSAHGRIRAARACPVRLIRDFQDRKALQPEDFHFIDAV